MEPDYALQKQAAEATSNGNYALALSLYERADRYLPGSLTSKIAEMHDKLGDYKDAILEYKQFFQRVPQNDPGMLTRCADLDMIYGSREDAKSEYLAAASMPSGWDKLMLTPISSGEPLSATSPLDSLRADAYYNVGLSLGGHGGLKYMELALTLEPQSPLMRFGYAHVCTTKDRMAEEWLAEQEATGKLKAAIRELRLGGRKEIYMGGRIDIKGGHAIQTMGTPWKPAGTIPTPRVPDPIKTRNPRWAEEGAPVTPAP